MQIRYRQEQKQYNPIPIISFCLFYPIAFLKGIESIAAVTLYAKYNKIAFVGCCGAHTRYVCIDYRFAIDGKYVPKNDEALMKECRAMFAPDIEITPRQLPLKDFLIIFKKNDNANQLYKGERGVPDIQGLASIEDALTESISDLIDAIRKGRNQRVCFR